MNHTEIKHDRRVKTASALLFPCVILYFELLLRLSTGIVTPAETLLPLFWFSLAWGMLFGLLTAMSSDRLRRAASAAGLGVLAVLYLVEYFVFAQFKIFYDVSTILGGAGGALTGFFGEIMTLIFSFNGLLKIFLYVLPLVLYLFLGRAFRVQLQRKCRWLLVLTALFVACNGIAFSSVLLVSTHRLAYRQEYNFQTAVERFGLLTGLRLDVKYLLRPADQGNFESAEPQETPEATAEVPIYGRQTMELTLPEGMGDRVDELNSYVSSLRGASQNAYTGLFRGKNLIFLTAEAFSLEAIDSVMTPTLHRLYSNGIRFTDYYQPAGAGTTGGEYQNIFGMLPTAGGMSFKKTARNNNYFTMGSQLNRLGYYGMAFHNNDYTYYDRHKTHNNIGFSEGFMGYGNGMEAYVQHQWPQSDFEMVKGTLPLYVDRQPFHVYYMTVSGHSNYTPGANAMTRKHWQRVSHLTCSDQLKGYLAANLDLEDALQYLVQQLEERGIADDTVICLTPDHFPYGLDRNEILGDMPHLAELYGFEPQTLLERDHSCLLLWSGCLEDMEPIVIDTPTSSLDILPTLSNLFGTLYDSRLMVGRDVLSDAVPLVFNLNYDWKTELGTYHAASDTFTPAQGTDMPGLTYMEYWKTVVRNKIRFCKGVLETDYFGLLFPEKCANSAAE